MLYAAQASFFVITSAVPFSSLLITIASIFLPDAVFTATDFYLSDGLDGILGMILAEIEEIPDFPLISISTATALWTASKGIGAIRGGIETVYSAQKSKGFFLKCAKNALTTLTFIVFLTSAAVLLLFGDNILALLEIKPNIYSKLKLPVISAALALSFTYIYRNVAKRSKITAQSFKSHLPGGIFSSLGWIVFSYFYSIYIEYFPSPGKVYGSLAALCLVMLWVYFCMMILLLGAEINKFYIKNGKN